MMMMITLTGLVEELLWIDVNYDCSFADSVVMLPTVRPNISSLSTSTTTPAKPTTI